MLRFLNPHIARSRFSGAPLYPLHGRQNQPKRLEVFDTFSSKRSSAILLCTDIAARGIDFPGIDWVVQLNCPPDVDTYIHRVGRTARYESKGHAVLFLLPSETRFLSRLEERGVIRQRDGAEWIGVQLVRGV